MKRISLTLLSAILISTAQAGELSPAYLAQYRAYGQCIKDGVLAYQRKQITMEEHYAQMAMCQNTINTQQWIENHKLAHQ